MLNYAMRKKRKEEGEMLKDFLFWWMLIYNIAVITIKPIRKALIDFLKNM